MHAQERYRDAAESMQGAEEGSLLFQDTATMGTVWELCFVVFCSGLTEFILTLAQLG